jgi:hypothetical protein
MLDLATTEAPRVRSVEAGRVRFQPILLLAGGEANDHDADSIVTV